MPVSFRTASSCLMRSAFAALCRFRFACGSGVDSAGDGLVEAPSVLGRELVEQPPVGRDAFEHIEGGANLFVKRDRRRVRRRHRYTA